MTELKEAIDARLIRRPLETRLDGVPDEFLGLDGHAATRSASSFLIAQQAHDAIEHIGALSST
ncbi:MAG: hypothetical protein ABUL42_03240 [Terricaulis silvestris]